MGAAIGLSLLVAGLWSYGIAPAIDAMKPPTELVCTPRAQEFVCKYQPVAAPDQVAAASE
jgi:hypothetical protein